MGTNLKDYFAATRGTGILATADSDGMVNTAVYSRPFVRDDGSLAFIMANRLTRANLQRNPRASYLFLEAGAGYRGCRLQLTMTGEEKNPELIEQICTRCKLYEASGEAQDLTVNSFTVDQQLPLIGAGEVLDRE
ncbi:MAG: pyridoxamine 5'-phosphate oxidase family protein [Deltaproteobacteria bacterium]|nr:pyridoxamine 5'-phosphate oxidase family protein [Candidatus Anaeroferrophillacea bacterium]